MWIGDLARLLNDVANAASVLVPVTIASGQSLSSAGALNGFKVVGFLPGSRSDHPNNHDVAWCDLAMVRINARL
jgi:hypothetical protein